VRSKSSRKLKGITGLSLDPDGFGVAHVVRNGAEAARLEVCAYQALERGEEPAAQIASLLREHSLEQTPCVFALRPGQYSLRQIDAPAVEPDELRDAARWAIKDLVDFDVVEAVVDAFEVPRGE
jgi:MSHA biogenesis protein MshI